jgi:hypothetical protein
MTRKLSSMKVNFINDSSDLVPSSAKKCVLSDSESEFEVEAFWKGYRVDIQGLLLDSILDSNLDLLSIQLRVIVIPEIYPSG